MKKLSRLLDKYFDQLVIIGFLLIFLFGILVGKNT